MVLRRVEIACESNDAMDSAQSQTEPRIFPVPDPVPSYWLSEPHKYSNLRSTASLPSTCDVAIIGSGMAGVATAYHILQDSPQDNVPNIVLLEARDLCSGATARNGGHSKVKTATLTNLPPSLRGRFQTYVLGVITSLKQIVDAEELDCEFELRRSFDVFCDAVEAREIKHAYDEAKTQGETWTREVSYVDERVAEQVTSIAGAKGAFSVPAASFWPYKFVTQVVERMVERYPESLNVQTNTLVRDVKYLEEQDDGDEDDALLTRYKNKLITQRGSIHAKKVVFATNAYTAGLLPAFKNTIIPVKGMASHHGVPTLGKQVHPHLNQTYNIHFAPRDGHTTGVDYLNPRPNGSIVVGGGSWRFSADRASWYDNFDDSERFGAQVEAYWQDYMPDRFRGWEGSGAQPDYVWVGVMGRTGDGVPHVGRVPEEEEQSDDGVKEEEYVKRRKGKGRQQWVLAGFNGGGMALIGTAAKAVAKMVREDMDFEDVEGEFGLLREFRTGWERMEKGVVGGSSMESG